MLTKIAVTAERLVDPNLQRRQRRRSRFDSEVDGGGERDRTDDLLLAKQALSQLSYTPDDENGGSGWI